MGNCQQGVINTLKWDHKTQKVSQELSKLPTGKMPQEKALEGTFLTIRIRSLNS